MSLHICSDCQLSWCINLALLVALLLNKAKNNLHFYCRLFSLPLGLKAESMPPHVSCAVIWASYHESIDIFGILALFAVCVAI